MKAALCFASLAVLAGVISAAPYAWDLHTVYTYRVQSRFAAGMLGLDGPTVDDTETDRALVELTWKVDIYKTQPNEIYMNPRDFKAVIAKEKIPPVMSQFLPKLKLPSHKGTRIFWKRS